MKTRYEDTRNKGTAQPPGEGHAKKPYQSPQLLVYGDIREITRSVAKTNANDGAVHGQKVRTS